MSCVRVEYDANAERMCVRVCEVRTVCCVDTETTGVSPHTSSILSVAAVVATLTLHADTGRVMSSKIEQQYHVFIKPEGRYAQVPNTRIHGITYAMCEALGRPLRVVRSELLELVRPASTLLAYNASFDARMLLAEGIDLSEGGKREWECVARLYRERKGLRAMCKLQVAHEASVCRTVSETPKKWHDALEDAQAALDVYLHLVTLASRTT